MQEHALRDRIEKTERQRNVAIAISVMFAATACLTSLTALTKADKVVLVPSVVDEYSIHRTEASTPYLLQVTRDAAFLLLNRHPHDKKYFEENIMRLVDPEYHDDLRRRIKDAEEANTFKVGRQSFLPSELCRIPGSGLQTEISGLVETYVNGKTLTSEAVTRRFTFVMRGTYLRIVDIEDIAKGEEACPRLQAFMENR